MKFIPEERAKKLSFDRMIFKLEPTEETLKVWDHDFEYRFDITLVSYFYFFAVHVYLLSTPVLSKFYKSLTYLHYLGTES